MKHLFYFMAIFAILWEMQVLLQPKRVHNMIQNFKSNGKKKAWDELTSAQRSLSVLMLFYTIWALIGLFSSQWVLFMALISISLIPKKMCWIRFIDSLISLMILVLIILNKYHFHVSIFDKLIKSIF